MAWNGNIDGFDRTYNIGSCFNKMFWLLDWAFSNYPMDGDESYASTIG